MSKDFSGRNALYQRRSICLEGNEFARNAVLEFEAMGKLIMLNAIFYGGLMAIFFPLVYAAVVSPPGPSPAIAESGATTGWFSVFTSLSALHNCGLTLVNTSLVPVANQPGVLFLLGTLILIGNTGLPVVLYLLVRIARRFARDKAPWDYLLVHGRKFSIFLFNGAQTLLLGIILVILLLIQFVAFLALNLNRSDLLVSYSAGSLVYLGAFQSVCTRNAGFVVVSLRAVSPALLVLFAVMMYLSPVPYVLTLRTSMPSSSSERKRAEPIQRNDAEYASLTTTHGAASGTTTSPVLYEIGKTFGNLLVFDIAWLFMALFVICIAENYILRNSIQEVETLGTVTVFDILFEIASAYGNVGYSVGVNNNDFSLSGIFSVFSKLVIIATMYGGRIRSIPQSSDEAARFRFDRNMMDVTQSSLLRPTLRLRALERRSSRSIQAERPIARGKQR
ncbi:transporter [Cyanidiococcus yangmingshanensis]|uniref:Transporter n=1 Tax=Cyanidiococcus yangmingshanensis TaxID=2690220 RepID=A0A7J7IHL1_9RHOD|nr:transporter [Cyanidiococcus yangmingshanensis]